MAAAVSVSFMAALLKNTLEHDDDNKHAHADKDHNGGIGEGEHGWSFRGGGNGVELFQVPVVGTEHPGGAASSRVLF